MRVHRIVGLREQGYLLAGDGHCTGVDVVAAEGIHGIVCARYRKGVRMPFGGAVEVFSGLLRYRFRSVRLLIRRIRARFGCQAGAT